MQYARFGLTELTVCRVGVGCAAMGGYDYGRVDDSESKNAIRRALDLGINFFDTADVYGLGHSEIVLSEALGARRHDAVIATKFGLRWDEQGRTSRDCGRGRVVEALENSLRRLRVDRIPVYQIHWPDPATPIAETLSVLRKCQESGKIGFIGCCNFSLDLVQETMSLCRIESIQLPYSLAEQGAAAALRLLRERYRLAVLSYSPLAQGLFSGKYGRNAKFEGTDLRRRSPLFEGDNLERNLALLERIRVVAGRHDCTPAQVAIRWLLENEHVTCVLTGVKTLQQVEENYGALGLRLSSEDLHYLNNGRAQAEALGQASRERSRNL